MIRDIYHWRLQTTLAIIAGYDSLPLKEATWLIATGFPELLYGSHLYTVKILSQSINTGFLQCGKYSIKSIRRSTVAHAGVFRLIPGLMTIEIVTLGFPIYAIFKNKKAAREVNNALADFDQKRLSQYDDSTTLGGSQKSLQTKGSSNASSRKGKMYPMESLDACLHGAHDGLQIYASCMELNGENIIFLTKVIAFTKQCQKAFQHTCNMPSEFQKARSAMFRLALSIFVSLVHSATASYPINIESNIYHHLDSIFGPATALVASAERSRSPSIATPVSSSVTPWDDVEPAADDGNNSPSYPLRALSRKSSGTGNESSEHIVHVREDEAGRNGSGAGGDPLDGVKVPADFDERVFDAAYKSVRYMVWSETWQRYMQWRRTSQTSTAAD